MGNNTRIFVSFEGVVANNTKFRKEIIESLPSEVRVAYKSGIARNEQDYLEKINWYKEYKRLINKDSMRVLVGCREMIPVSRCICEAEKKAIQRILEEKGYTDELYSIMLKKSEFELTDKEAPEQRIEDISQGVFAVTENALVHTDKKVLSSWYLHGGKAFQFDPYGKEDISTLESSDGKSVVKVVKTLRMVPMALGIYKSKK
ncbi:MAG: hypothetical protein IKP98_01130 [Bacilli bacterium]|nr:hypothetical protein [Bacilli bacterium]